MNITMKLKPLSVVSRIKQEVTLPSWAKFPNISNSGLKIICSRICFWKLFKSLLADVKEILSGDARNPSMREAVREFVWNCVSTRLHGRSSPALSRGKLADDTVKKGENYVQIRIHNLFKFSMLELKLLTYEHTELVRHLKFVTAYWQKLCDKNRNSSEGI